jgi:hypothetical protein
MCGLGPCKEKPRPEQQPQDDGCPAFPAKTGVELIANERQRQIEKEGWTPEHDDWHLDGALSSAAECYLLELRARKQRGQVVKSPPPAWPWERDWWKPSGDPIRNLVKAGALIAAEIDRLQRLAARDGKEGA